MSYTPFQAPILAGLLGDEEIAALFSVKADLAAMLRFEIALADAQAEAGLFAPSVAAAIGDGCRSFTPDIAAIGAATARDGVCVPELIRQLRAALGEKEAEWLHFGATSQDVIDTAFILRLKEVTQILKRRLEALNGEFDALEERFGGNALVARTRMQAAWPVTVADRIAAWRRPLAEHLRRLAEISPRLLRLQYGGPVGTLEELGGRAGAIAENLASRLALNGGAPSWHTDRATIVEFASWLSLVAGGLGKFGMDMALMAQNERAELTLRETGGSSAMAHKQNPVKAEALVALARFAAVQAGGVQHALVHEQERSGSAWTLEWLLMPQLCVALGASTRNAAHLARSVTAMGRPS
jgi:3-carboxy-cis,cis-muconate cycloisomerase